MSGLATSLRNQLAKVIIEARRVAEVGAHKVLESLAVERHEPYESMSLEERALRNRLRVHGRQLGDVRDKQRGNQSIARLAHEVAYEHWHRMLFARFLAENGLLIHPDHDVAISLKEVEELARETGVDPHQMAAGFAQDSLPQIFRTGDPVLEVRLAPETRQKLEVLLDSLPTDVFTADDSLGWTYQYWQSEKKKAVNDSGEKIGADELPAVTQLFTEHYMVLFLYHNTIGAWHAGKVLAANPSLAETAQNEDELRAAVSLDTAARKSTFEYLRFAREPQEGDEDDNPTGPWCPAAGTFEGWPKTAKELKVLDPCCGSGHFLVVGFNLLVRLRMYEEGLGVEDAIRAVLNDNIFGLELDPRCTQIAAFNLATAAWKLAGKPIALPELSIACSGLPIGSSKKDWLALTGDDERLGAGMENLYSLFRQASELGSLIDPKALNDDMFEANFAELQPLLEQAFSREENAFEDTERAVVAQGMARAAGLLSGEYILVITNPPYLLRAKQSERLQEFISNYYKLGDADLATAFLQRFDRFCGVGGSHATVTPQNWLFISSYKGIRQSLLSNSRISIVARVGSGATAQASWDVLRALVVVSRMKPDPENLIVGIDAPASDEASRALELLRGKQRLSTHRSVINGPDARLSIGVRTIKSRLDDVCHPYQGLATGDYFRFGRKFWEQRLPQDDWVYHQGTVKGTLHFGGRSDVLFWEKGAGNLSISPSARVQGLDAHGRSGVAITQTRSLPAALYSGDFFDNNVAVVMPDRAEFLTAIWCYCSSDDFTREVRKLDEKLGVTNATIGKIPFDLEHWQKVADKEYPCGLPEPQSNDPTQWLFHGHPAKAKVATVLQVAVGRLLGYQWPPELDSGMHLGDEARDWSARCDALNKYADEDGIVCLSPTRGESYAADRLRELLSSALGSSWSAAKERELLTMAGDGKKPANSLADWLRDKFFEEHCKLLQHRPFIWHVWDGNRDGFHCLVNVHKIAGPDGEGRRTLEAITYSYLGDWIDRQKDDQQAMVEGADARLASAQDLQKQLEKILEGKPPYDLFVRWKPLHEQAIGWDPDINDGVRLNVRPFMNAELRKGGKKGAGILRWKPNVKWKKDRGKEPQSLRPKEDFPWFWGCNGDGSEIDVTDYTAERTARADFDGNRWNDLHYSRAAKEAARAAAKEKQQEIDE